MKCLLGLRACYIHFTSNAKQAFITKGLKVRVGKGINENIPHPTHLSEEEFPFNKVNGLFSDV